MIRLLEVIVGAYLFAELATVKSTFLRVTMIALFVVMVIYVRYIYG